MAYIEIATAVPLNVVDKNRELPANYHWKHMDAWKSNEQFMEMESGPCKPQKFQNNDILFLQVMADFSPIFIQVRRLSSGLIVLNHQMTNVATVGTKSYFEDQIAFDNLTLFAQGEYQVEFLGGDPVQVSLITEPISIKEEHENTLLARYYNNFNTEIWWESNIYFNFRFDGVIPYKKPASKRTTYIDQIYNAKTTKGRGYRIFDLTAGTQGGSPKWHFDLLEEIMCQTNVEFDGKAFTGIVGAEFEINKVDRYPYWRGSMEVMESLNKRAKRFEGTGINLERWATDYVVEGALFGPIDGSANDNTYLIDRLT